MANGASRREGILFAVGTLASPDDYDLSPIDALVLATGERKTVFTGASCVRYAPTGHLLLARAASLSAVKFDPVRLVVSGEPVPVVHGTATDTTTGAAHFAFADNGTPVYLAGGGDLYFRRDTQLLAVSAEAGEQFRSGEPRVVVDGIYNLRSGSLRSYDVDPKRERFLMIRPANSAEIAPITSLHIELNWLADLRAKMK